MQSCFFGRARDPRLTRATVPTRPAGRARGRHLAAPFRGTGYPDWLPDGNAQPPDHRQRVLEPVRRSDDFNAGGSFSLEAIRHDQEMERRELQRKVIRFLVFPGAGRDSRVSDTPAVAVGGLMKPGDLERIKDCFRRAQAMGLSIDAASFAYRWPELVEEYPPKRAPGVVQAGEKTLLYYDRDSLLAGIFTLHPNKQIIVIVHPDRQGRGIGTKLLEEAVQRWDIDFKRQRYTLPGAELVMKFLERKNRA